MGVVVRISAYFPPEIDPPNVLRGAFARVGFLSRKFSSYREDSELRRVEDSAWREQTRLSPEFAHLLGHALRLARKSGGAFDPTLGRVTRLIRAPGWQRDGPTEEALRKAWGLTGWRHVELDASSREISIARRGLQFDLGGIAKGYAADEALATLERAGVRRAMVAVAGDIAVGDPPPGKDGWRIGLDGLGPLGSVERKLTLTNQGISTSGSRERYYLADDRRCSHIVSSSTDGCTDTSLAASVVAPTALEADGIATALIALGEGESGAILDGRPDVSVYWSVDDLTKASAGAEDP